MLTLGKLLTINISMKQVVLESVELAGFKSFAKRTRIEVGSKFCAIVGPNGSGKSNIADAVRWVLGEQKNRLLRTQKSEEIIFHGGHGKARSSMAEVTLRLQNPAGLIPIDFAEIEITRQLYRSGESNYLLNGKKVTATYLQELLSKGKFGVGSYTVIGQGMIDRLVLSSGSDRKLLFDEASGIKQFELKLNQTRNKLSETQQNLNQITAVLQDISPNHKNLLSQLETLKTRDGLQAKLINLKHEYLGFQKQSLAQQLSKVEEQLAELKTNHHALLAELASLEKKQSELTKTQKDSSAAHEKTRTELERAEAKRDQLIEKISACTAELNTLIPQSTQDSSKLVKQIDAQAAKYQAQLKNITVQIKNYQKKISKFESNISKLDTKVAEKTKELNDVRKQLAQSQKREYLTHALGLLNLLQKTLAKPGGEAEAKVIFYKLHRMISHSLADNGAELALQIGRIQNIISHYLAEREQIVEAQTTEIIGLRSLEMDQGSLAQAIADLKDQKSEVQNESSSAVQKQRIKTVKTTLADLQRQKDTLDKTVASLRDDLTQEQSTQTQDLFSQYSKQHEKLATQLTRLSEEEKHLKQIQEATNQETTELRQRQQDWFGNRSIKLPAKPQAVNLDSIMRLEAELSLLGDVDPNVEKELQDTTTKVEFLTNQQQDLESAIINLNKAIAELETKIDKTFHQNFSKINQKFNQYFQKLFVGGKAELTLQENDSSYGIEINVQLPHKKTQNLASLSGGEKALASVALLCGILSANPSPFVVLDEVDAALDEQNTLKFSQILQEIAKSSQVLVITHNHDTMAAADELVGVTTTTKGDSQILRVALTQAEALTPNPKNR